MADENKNTVLGVTENIEALHGRGIYLMSHLADKIEYSKKGNSVKMTFKNILS